MTANAIVKMIIGVGLFSVWVGLLFLRAYDPSMNMDIADIITFIKEALIGLGLYHAMDGKKP